MEEAMNMEEQLSMEEILTGSPLMNSYESSPERLSSSLSEPLYYMKISDDDEEDEDLFPSFRPSKPFLL